ncbi:uncharacterized protein LOC112680430 [Sipha flava]|uniref:Uncharacterized protein LOC112680430 n=1 Tax=Sipha flava TaxID=143950 RepID=A0A8B8F638_9HEMI|nr:uncharacterized protein LOC112680430 [Sipha flava]
MANTASSAMCNRGPVSLLPLLALLTVSALLSALLCPTPVAAVPESRHVRHKRTVSELVEGLMNAMYFHVDPLPLPSTVITRITHVPAAKVYKYVPVQKLKFSKLRARQIAEPKLKLKYPKKISIKTEDSSLTVVKNDLPWTLHPLPPPLPTAKTIRLEVDKSMPWALHPLPPPVKTKNYSDYYWPDSKTRPKYYHRFKPPKTRQNNFIKNNNNYKVVYSKPATNFKPSDHKPTEYNAVDHQPDDHNDVEYKPADYKPDNYKDDEFNPVDYKHVEYTPVDFKQIEYKHVDYKHVDYKSPDYKTDYPKNNDEEHGGDDPQNVYHHSYTQDEHSSQINNFPSPSSHSPPTEYVSHITIEPSIQIASFSETEMQGDGSNRETISQGDTKQKCQCTINGHRHKRNVNKINDTTATANTTSMVQIKDLDVGRSSWNSYVTPRSGHASEVQILKSHDITDQSMINNPIGYVQQVRAINVADAQHLPETHNGDEKKLDSNFRDESDKFKVDFGREVKARDELKSADSTGRFLQSNPNDYRDSRSSLVGNVGGEGRYSGFNIDDYKSRLTRKPNQEKSIHITKSKVENTDRGVSFSVQTPFSVSSFSSKIRHPMTDERPSQFRFTELKTTSSPLFSSFKSEYAKPLDFEHFGLKSVLIDDKPPTSERLTTHFSRGFNDNPSETIGQRTSHYLEGFGRDKSSYLPNQQASLFSRDFGDDDRSSFKISKPFRYHTKSSTSDLFNSQLRGVRPSEESVLEYFQPIVIDFEKISKDKEDNNFKLFGKNNEDNENSRYFGKSESTGISKFKKNQNLDPLRLPGRLHESNENLSRKMIFHPSMFDIDK